MDADQNCQATMESSMEISMEGSIMKMSTSESEQSISEKCSSRSSAGSANRSSIFFEQFSEEDMIPEEVDDNASQHHPPGLNGDGDSLSLQSLDSLGSIEKFLADSENHNVSFEKSNYFSLTFANEDHESLTQNSEDSDEAFKAGAFLNSTPQKARDVKEDSEAEGDKTLVCNVSNLSQKKTSLKLFSPQKVLTAMTRMQGDRLADSVGEVEEKISPMDCVSSPDSLKSFAEDVKVSLGTVSLSEESFTRVQGASGGDKGPEQEAGVTGRGQDSLDEISSGEMSDGSFCAGVQEFWDEEYLSEYHYDEPIDKDKERQLMSFGDDYRNFLGSLSESQGSIGGWTGNNTSKKKSKRLSKKKLPDSARSYDTCSDNEADDVKNFIADSQRSINCVESQKSSWEEDGFVKEEHISDYNELVGICSENLKTIITVFGTKDLQETFVSKKKSRDMRFLLHKWERLHNRIKENLQQSGVYGALRADVLNFRRDLTGLLERTEDQGQGDREQELENRLHNFQDAMNELSDFKSHLFELNLSVHNFLAELNSSKIGGKAKFEHAVHLKEDVIGLYNIWDRAHHQTAGSIASTEESLKKLKCFETELLSLRDTLRNDARVLKEKGTRRRGGNGKGKSSSGDSGISDDGCLGYFTDGDLPLRKEHLSKLQMMAKSLEQNLPASSTPMMMINHTLQTTSEELEDLQKTYSKFQTLKSRKPKSIAAVKEKEATVKLVSYESLRRRQVVKVALLMNGLLLFTALLCWLCQPRCCDDLNTLRSISFQPQLRYVNGPPPT